jgi:hypothetical protein
MNNEAAIHPASTWQTMISTMASLCSWLWAGPHSEKPQEPRTDQFFSAWKDEPPEVKRFIALQMERGFWI